jgi:hypothetical protein
MIRVAIQIEGMAEEGKEELAEEIFDFFRSRNKRVHVQIETASDRLEGPHSELWNFAGALTLQMHETFIDERS